VAFLLYTPYSSPAKVPLKPRLAGPHDARPTSAETPDPVDSEDANRAF
jgi:hypothetical protein